MPREQIVQGLSNGPIRTVTIKNNNSANTLVDGQPIFYDGNDVSSVVLGIDVKDYAGIAAGAGMAAGIVKVPAGKASLAVGDYGEAICFGFTDAIVVRRVRANSTQSWPTAPAIGVGDMLVPETANKYLTLSQTQAIGAAQAAFVAGQSYASKDSIASSAGSDQPANTAAAASATAETVRMKVFVRCM